MIAQRRQFGEHTLILRVLHIWQARDGFPQYTIVMRNILEHQTRQIYRYTEAVILCIFELQ
jgi:hypothetical protein